MCVPPPGQQAVAWSGLQLLTKRGRTQTVWLQPPSFSGPADCQGKAPQWLLFKRKKQIDAIKCRMEMEMQRDIIIHFISWTVLAPS